MNRLLIVEDDRRLASFLERALRSRGYATEVVGDGSGARAVVAEGRCDLVLLDLGLPDIDGIELLRQLRERTATLPVVVLTARDDPEDEVAGFDAGASDYLTKPFKLQDLLARIKAQLRGGHREPTRLEAGKLALDLRSRKAIVDGEPIELTAREFTMLQTLMEHRDQALSREQLLERVWGSDHGPSEVVELYIGYLRRRLGGKAIETVPGVGYRLRSTD
jgi:DNA-binding response OmpR family regulator